MQKSQKNIQNRRKRKVTKMCFKSNKGINMRFKRNWRSKGKKKQGIQRWNQFFHCQVNLQNFDEKVKLDEDTPPLFIFIFYITVYNICYISFEVIYYFEGHDYCFGMFKYDLNIACICSSFVYCFVLICQNMIME